LKERKDASIQELDRIWEDLQRCPINYNHYYTNTIEAKNLRGLRARARLQVEELTKILTVKPLLADKKEL